MEAARAAAKASSSDIPPWTCLALLLLLPLFPYTNPAAALAPVAGGLDGGRPNSEDDEALEDDEAAGLEDDDGGLSTLKGPVKKLVIFDWAEEEDLDSAAAALLAAAAPAREEAGFAPSQLWSKVCLWARQKFCLQLSHNIGTNSFFLHLGLEHLFVKTFFLALSDLQS